MATQHNCVTHIIKSDLHSYNSTCQYHQTMAKQFFIKFCIKILVKLIANTEKSIPLSSVIIADFVCILLTYNTIKVQQFPQITKFNYEFSSRTRVLLFNKLSDTCRFFITIACHCCCKHFSDVMCTANLASNRLKLLPS